MARKKNAGPPNPPRRSARLKELNQKNNQGDENSTSNASTTNTAKPRNVGRKITQTKDSTANAFVTNSLNPAGDNQNVAFDSKRGHIIFQAFQIHNMKLNVGRKTTVESEEQSFDDQVAVFAYELFESGLDTVLSDIRDQGVDISIHDRPYGDSKGNRNVAWKLTSYILGFSTSNIIYKDDDLCFGVSPTGQVLVDANEMDKALRDAKFDNGIYRFDWRRSLRMSGDGLETVDTGIKAYTAADCRFKGQLNFLNFVTDEEAENNIVRGQQASSRSLAALLYHTTKEPTVADDTLFNLDAAKKAIYEFLRERMREMNAPDEDNDGTNDNARHDVLYRGDESILIPSSSSPCRRSFERNSRAEAGDGRVPNDERIQKKARLLDSPDVHFRVTAKPASHQITESMGSNSQASSESFSTTNSLVAIGSQDHLERRRRSQNPSPEPDLWTSTNSFADNACLSDILGTLRQIKPKLAKLAYSNGNHYDKGAELHEFLGELDGAILLVSKLHHLFNNVNNMMAQPIHTERLEEVEEYAASTNNNALSILLPTLIAILQRFGRMVEGIEQFGDVSRVYGCEIGGVKSNYEIEENPRNRPEALELTNGVKRTSKRLRSIPKSKVARQSSKAVTVSRPWKRMRRGSSLEA
jgi:hypothetical protein